jgi:small subunit ribosomal protein S14
LAKKSQIAQVSRKPKFRVRAYNRCRLCGRSRGYYRRFSLCRICFRNLSLEGKIPGVIKSSW